MDKVGLGIITCNRQPFYQQCIDSISLDCVDELITINDGAAYFDHKPVGYFVQHSENKGVGVSKNEALQYLLDKGCDHLFLIEDDIIVKDNEVFQKYINTAAATGMWHLMFGYHGPANKDQNKNPNPRAIAEIRGQKVALNRHCVGAFCYYHRAILNHIGLMDEEYVNAWEHVDHSYQIVKAGLLPAFWWWPDVENSCDYLDELACSEVSSTIRPRPDWKDNIITGANHFKNKHGYIPGQIPDTSPEDIDKKLNFIKDNYSKNEKIRL